MSTLAPTLLPMRGALWTAGVLAALILAYEVPLLGIAAVAAGFLYTSGRDRGRRERPDSTPGSE